jgi:hypothetical protein
MTDQVAPRTAEAIAALSSMASAIGNILAADYATALGHIDAARAHIVATAGPGDDEEAREARAWSRRALIVLLGIAEAGQRLNAELERAQGGATTGAATASRQGGTGSPN